MQGHNSTPLYALIIGIDKYRHHSKLVGAVNDANAFQNYLKSDLNIPSNHIFNLRDDEATREEIIRAFRKLQNDDRIKRGDPIVIFYAGHGGQSDAPEGWVSSGGKIQSLVPVDCSSREGTQAKKILPIPDRTIAALLTNISDAKGDNITVIFDCCHSASGTRVENPVSSRHVDEDRLPKIKNETDSNILASKSSSRALADQAPCLGESSTGTHVLLAACAEAQEAQEHPTLKQGYFTLALLDVLRTHGISTLTYSRCMRILPKLESPKPQNPTCEGLNSGRFFFNSKVQGADFKFIPIALKAQCNTNESDDGSSDDDTAGESLHGEGAPQLYVLSAGTAQGITKGCLFDLYATDVAGPNNPPLAQLVVRHSDIRHADLQAANGSTIASFPPNAYARQTGSGPDQSMNVFFTSDIQSLIESDTTWKSDLAMREKCCILSRVRTLGDAEMVVGVNGQGEATFRIVYPPAIDHGVDLLPHTVPAKKDSVMSVLVLAARWRWHLHRAPARSLLSEMVRVEFQKLEESDPDNVDLGLSTRTPTGPNLNRDGVVELVVKKNQMYGLTIHNDSPCNLHAYSFYFGVADQCILPRYLKATGSVWKNPASSEQGPSPDSWKQSSLPSGGKNSVGYGASGVKPFQFELDKGIDVDVGVIKIFLTSGHADFDSMAQPPIFDLDEAGRRLKDDEQDGDSSEPIKERWDVITLTVVQRRKKRNLQPTSKAQRTEAPSSLPPAKLVTHSSGPITVRGGDSSLCSKSWFRTPQLSAAQASLRHLQLQTRSKDQGRATNSNGNWTWFDVQVINAQKQPKLGSNGAPLRWTSHYNTRGPTEYTLLQGPEFGPDHEIWDELIAGDSIEVIANAQLRGWVNDAQEGILTLW